MNSTKKFSVLSLCLLFISTQGMQQLLNWLPSWKTATTNTTEHNLVYQETTPRIDITTNQATGHKNNLIMLEKPVGYYDFARDPNKPDAMSYTDFSGTNLSGNDTININNTEYPLAGKSVCYPIVSYNATGESVAFKAKRWASPLFYAQIIQLYAANGKYATEIQSTGCISDYVWHPTNPELIAIRTAQGVTKQQAEGFEIYRVNQETGIAQKTAGVTTYRVDGVLNWCNMGWAVNAQKNALVSFFRKSESEYEKLYLGQWDIEGKQTHEWLVPEAVFPEVLKVSPLGSLVALCNDKTIDLCDLDTGEKLQTIPGEQRGWVCAWSGNCIAIAQPDKSVMLWDITAQKPYVVIQHKDRIKNGAFSKDGQYFAAITPTNELSITNLKTMHQQVIDTNGSNFKLAWSCDNKNVQLLQSSFDAPAIGLVYNNSALIKSYDVQQ